MIASSHLSIKIVLLNIISDMKLIRIIVFLNIDAIIYEILYVGDFILLSKS